MTPSHRLPLSVKAAGMFFSKVWSAIIRVTAALLLFATFVMPALAEIGCAEESIAHLQDGGSEADQPQVASSDEPQGDQETGSQPDHCAFNHGHCAGIATASARSDHSVADANSYVRLASRPLVANPADAPERPPSA